MSDLSRIPEDREASDYKPGQGFYSALGRTIRHIRKVAGADGTIQPQQALTWLAARQRDGWFKLSELHWSGLDDWLKAQHASVHVSEIISFVRDNGVRVQEVIKGADPLPAERGRELAESHGHVWENLSVTDRRRYTQRAAGHSLVDPIPTETAYGKYTLPGGTNYRELLLTLPKKDPRGLNEIAQAMYGRRFSDLGDDEANKVVTAEANEVKASNFASSHWREKNILAHVRFNERVDAARARVLFIEELQSDWAQDGLKNGFGSNSIEQAGEWWNIKNQRGQVIDQQDTKERAEQVASRMRSIPAAPFVTDTKAWLSLSLKRIIQYAVEHGYDRVAFITGDQSAQRYDLSKVVESVEYRQRTEGPKQGTGLLTAYDHSGNQVMSKVDARPGDLANVIGHEATARLMQSPGPGYMGSSDKAYVLAGESLRVGGDGMRVFYDHIVPQAVNDVLKKLGGGKVGLIALGYGGEPEMVGIDDDGAGIYSDGAPEGMLQPGFDITPGLRSGVEEGVPLFSRFSPQRSLVISAAAGAAARAVSAGADARLGRARPIQMATAGGRVAPHIEQILRDGRPSGETGENGLLLLQRALRDVALAGPHDLRALAAKVERLLPREGSMRLTIDDTTLTPMNGAVHLAPHVDMRLYTAEGRTGLTYETLLHESLHVAVAARYKTLASEAAREGKRSAAGAAIEQFYHVWREFCSMAAEDSIEDADLALAVSEACRSPDEFFVRAMTDPMLQAHLNNRHYDGKSLWQRFMDWIRSSLFGTDSARLAPSWLDAALAASHDLAEAMQSDAADFSRLDGAAGPEVSRSRAQESTPEFLRWFGSSKAVDDHGRPIPAFHGTGMDFDTFQGYEMAGWFSEVPEKANLYSRREVTDEEGNVVSAPNVMIAYISTKKPLKLPFDINDEMTAAEVYRRAELGVPDHWKDYTYSEPAWHAVNHADFVAAARAAGYDGIEVEEAGHRTWAIFDPTQVKSAIGNCGRFDPSDPSILASMRGLDVRSAIEPPTDEDALETLASGPRGG